LHVPNDRNESGPKLSHGAVEGFDGVLLTPTPAAALAL
jgi:hypothetical protein